MNCTSLAKDKLGYLWIGTRGGLNRFDGENFRIFTTEDGLLHDRILALDIDSNGHLIILTPLGINRFDGSNFTAIAHEFHYIDYYIYLDKNDELLILEGESKKVYLLKNNRVTVQHSGDIRQMYVDKNENLFFTNEQYQIYDRNSLNKPIIDQRILGGYMSRSVSAPISYNFGKKEIYKISKSGFTNIDVKEVATLCPEGLLTFANDFSFLLDEFNDKSIWHGLQPILDEINLIQDVIMEQDSSFWIAADNGLFFIPNNIINHYSKNDLPHIWNINESNEGCMYFTSYGHGAFKKCNNEIERLEHKSLHWFPGSVQYEDRLIFAKSRGLSDFKQNYDLPNNFTAFTVVKDELRNTYLIGTSKGFYTTKNFKAYTFYDQRDGLHALGHLETILVDRDYNYWLGSNQGLSFYTNDDNQFQNFTEEETNLPCNSVFSIYQDSSGIVWIGGDKGLMFYDTLTRSIQLLESNVINNNVKSISSIDYDHLLIGSKDGLFMFNRTDFFSKGRILFNTIDKSLGYTGIEPGFNGFFKDSKNRMWITSSTDVNYIHSDRFQISDQILNCHIDQIDDLNIPAFTTDTTLAITKGKSFVNFSLNAIGTTRPPQVKFKYNLDDQGWSDWFTENTLTLASLSHGNHHLKVVAGPHDLDPESLPFDQVQFQISIPFYKRAGLIPILGILLLCIIAWVIYNYIREQRARKEYRQQIFELQYIRNQMLLAEMNPHFIFNVLASIQNKILTGKKQEASEHLVNLSDIIRNFLQASHQSNSTANAYETDHSVKKDLELLEQFILFEKIKSNNHFNHKISIDEKIDINGNFIPPMILQPFVENAIKHGLLLDEPNGNLEVRIDKKEDLLYCYIIDDGVGREQAAKIYKGIKSSRKSLGLEITKERIELLNKIGHQVQIDIKDNTPKGTIVTIIIEQEADE